jgi:hypothetical protein
VGAAARLVKLPTHIDRASGDSTCEEAGFKAAAMFPASSDGDWVIEYDCILVREHSDA